ncbi:MAG: hydroxyacylglutathione hydrolase family protein [Geothermobacteraceae bacterium]
MALQVVQISGERGDNFSYLVFCDRSRQAMIIDSSFAAEKLLAELEARQLDLVMVANTHGHRDHTAGNDRIIGATGVPLAAHHADIPLAQIPLHNGQILSLGDGQVEVLHTPGHSPGSVVFRTDDAIITGDTLFISRCGRADLPGGDVERLYHSLQKLMLLPDELTVFPGHDYGPTPTATLGQEKQTNPFLLCPDLDSFIALRMG